MPIAKTAPADHLFQKLKSLLPAAVLEKITEFMKKAQLTQHNKSKERQVKKFQKLQLKNNSTNKKEILTWGQQTNHAAQDITHDRWVKNLSDRELTHTEKEVLAKGLNFAITLQEVPIVELITATESAIRKNNLPEPKPHR